MTDRDIKPNQIVASALQAQALDEFRIRRSGRANRPEQDNAEHFRRLAAASENAFSIGFPKVCTIH